MDQIGKSKDIKQCSLNGMSSSCRLISSNTPAACTQSPCMLGVDEAGRGPVLGPMVYGVCYTPIDAVQNLTDMGCDDSKALTETKREEIFDVICATGDQIGWAVDVISPNFICNKMLKRVKHSLNQIAEDSTVNLIQHTLNNGVNLTHVYVDTVGPPEKYQEKLSRIFPSLKITVAKKADSIYPVVSAASICAKVFRDRMIQTWTFPEGIDCPADGFGSGYPNDPETKKFLNQTMDNVFGFPQLVRFSWSTASKLLEKATPVEWEDEEQEAAHDNNKTITSFFKLSSRSKKHETKHPFFTGRNLTNMVSF